MENNSEFLYDFYFSINQKKDLQQTKPGRVTAAYMKTSINGKEFTYAQKAGDPLPTNYDDFVKVGTGTFNEVT